MRDIALYAGIAGGAEHIIIPEVEFDIDYICDKIIQQPHQGQYDEHCAHCRRRGQRAKRLQTICAQSQARRKGDRARLYPEGGTPSAADRLRATSMGMRAVQLLEKGSATALWESGITRSSTRISTRRSAKELVFRKDLYDEFKIMSENMQ